MFVVILAFLTLSAALTACSRTSAPTGGTSASQSAEGSSQSGTAQGETTADWLPAGVQRVMSETKPNADLEKAIIAYYQIPKEEWANTKYYYNYVDLNGDGTQEILAVVMGSYTSGTGGDSMLWVLPNAKMAVNEAFTLVRTPIIVTKDATNGQEFGAKGLIMQRSGGGAKTETVLLENTDGTYPRVNDAAPITDLSSVKGTAIICNDLAADNESGHYLTLAD
jgi:hypothetical protein